MVTYPNEKGTGLTELLLFIPLLLLLLWESFHLLTIMELKSTALHDSLAANIIWARKGKTPSRDFDETLIKKTKKLSIEGSQSDQSGNLLSLFANGAGRGREVSVEYTVKEITSHIPREDKNVLFIEKSKLVADPWDDASPVMKKMKTIVLYPPRLTFIRTLGKIYGGGP